MDISELLFELSKRDCIGNVREAADYAEEQLSRYADTKRVGGSIIGFVKGKADYTLLLDAHIDQVGMTVTNIDEEGFLTVAASGGIDIRALPSRTVTVHGKEKITAVFCSTPPHLASGETEYDDISKIKLDTMLGSKASETVSLGDYVTFQAKPCRLSGDAVIGRSFDDRAGVACLLKIAEELSGAELPVNVAFLLSDGEELGMRGAVTAAFNAEPNEAVAVDVSFGNGIGISPEECGKLGAGAMIGFAPTLDSCISARLVLLAENNGIKYQTEVMGGRTGTNADVISVSRSGVKTCTVSVPLRNMHTEAEVLRISDLNSVCELLIKYILSGGVFNA